MISKPDIPSSSLHIATSPLRHWAVLCGRWLFLSADLIARSGRDNGKDICGDNGDVRERFSGRQDPTARRADRGDGHKERGEKQDAVSISTPPLDVDMRSLCSFYVHEE